MTANDARRVRWLSILEFWQANIASPALSANDPLASDPLRTILSKLLVAIQGTTIGFGSGTVPLPRETDTLAILEEKILTGLEGLAGSTQGAFNQPTAPLRFASGTVPLTTDTEQVLEAKILTRLSELSQGQSPSNAYAGESYASGTLPTPADTIRVLLVKILLASNALVAADPPTALSINPTSGSTNGGTNVTITGTNFTGASSVKLGGTEVTSFIVVNSTTITAVTAAHTAGAVSVDVTTPGGTNAPNTLYTYIQADPFFSSVIALVKAEGTLTEVIGLCTMEIVGAGAISALQSKFGSTSFLNPGTGVPTSDFLKLIFPVGICEFPGSFTWEMWVYPRAINEDNFTALFSGQTNFGAAGCWTVQTSPLGPISFVSINTTGPQAPNGSFVANAWQHLAICRDGINPVRIFVNGVKKAEGTTVNAQGNLGAGQQWFTIARGVAADNASLDAYFEEVRVTKGVCRYNANFTPPTEPFPPF